MKLKSPLILAVLSLAFSTLAETYVTNRAVNMPVADDTPVGLSSAVALNTGLPAITGVRVSLNLSSEYNGDLYAYVAHGTNIAILLNRPGRSATRPFGYGDAGLNVTFTDSATNGDVHAYRQVATGSHNTPLPGALTGTWAPDGREFNPANALDTNPRTALLNRFIGAQPDGVWTLFVADFAPFLTSTLVSWSLEIATLSTNEIIPPPEVVTTNSPDQCFATNVVLGLPTVPFPYTTLSNNAPVQIPVGVTPVVWTAVKPGGEMISATQQVTVADVQNPSITPPADITLTVLSNQVPVFGLNLGTPIATDNCAIASVTSNAPASFPAGTTLVRWTATDPAGSSISATQRVIIQIDSPAMQHPRLFFGPGDVAGFRAKASLSPWSNMLFAIEWALYNDYDTGYTNKPSNFATLHVWRGVDTNNWADLARVATLNYIATPEWADKNYKSLTRANRALAVALAYDFCHDAWAGQTIPGVFTNIAGDVITMPTNYAGLDLRAGVSRALKDAGDALIAGGGSGWPGDTKIANNWFAVRYSAAGIAYLACDETGYEANLNTAISKLKTYLSANYGSGPLVNGWNVEGIAYAQYPGWFSHPFMLALNRVRGRDLVAEHPVMRFALWSTYQGVLPIERHSRVSRPGVVPRGPGLGLKPDFDDDHDDWDGEGTAALAFAFAHNSNPSDAIPDFDYRPGLKWMFRRLNGELGDHTWDCASGNGIYSLLFYPADLPEQNPESVWGRTYADFSYGAFMFRNRYQDSNDFVFQTTGNFRSSEGGHDGPDMMSFRLWGLNVPWAVGSGRTTDPRGQTTLFPEDPNNVTAQRNSLVPSLVDSFLRANGDGYVILTAETSDTGVNNQTRRMIVDYSGASGADGFFVVADTSADGQWWRLNTPDFNTITTAPGGFTITSLEGHTLRGTILWPTNITPRTGTFTRGSGFFYKEVNWNGAFGSGSYDNNNKWVDFPTADGQVLVAITVSSNGAAPPLVSANGTGINQTITAGTRVVTINSNQIQVNGWTRPTVAFTSPVNNASFNSGLTNIALTGTASDSDGVSRVDVYLDAALAGSATLGVSNTWSFTLSNVVVGQHTIEARAVDAVNDSGSAFLTVKVNSTVPPFCALDSPSFGSTLWGGQNVTFLGRASDLEGALNRVEVWADGAKLGNATLASGTWRYTWNAVKTGQHTVYALAFDNAGDFTQTPALVMSAGVEFSAVPQWGDAASYFVGGSFSQSQPLLNGSGRWSVVEEDGDLRLKVRPERSYDYDAHRAWLVGGDSIGRGNWRVSFRFKTGSPLTNNPECFVQFGQGDNDSMTLDLRPKNAVRASHPDNESGTRVWHRLNSGQRPSVAWSLNAATYPAAPTNDFAGIPNADWNDVRVDRVGRNLKVWVNHRLIMDGTNALLATKGRLGFGNERPFGTGGAIGFYDDVQVETLDTTGNLVSNTPATVAFVSPSPSPHENLSAGTPVLFAASVADPEGVSSVEFFLGSEKLGDAALSNGLWRLPWTAVNGTFVLSARVVDGSGNTNYAGALPFRVTATGGAGNAAPLLTITRDTNSPTLRFIGTATDSDGSIGQVQILRDGLAIATVGLTNGNWSFIYSNVPAGSHTYAARAIDDLTAIGSSAPLVYPADAFTIWTGSFGLTGNAALPEADPDLDTLGNFIEFAHGLNPTNPNPRSAVMNYALALNPTNSLTYIELTYRQRTGGIGVPGIDYTADGVTYLVQASPDLVSWGEGPAVVELVSAPVPNGDGTETVTLRIKPDIATQSVRFVRLRLIRQ